MNWWKRTALPSANFQTCANGHVERLAAGLRPGGVAPEHDDVVVAAEDLARHGVEVLPPLLVERVEDRGADGREAVVDAAVAEALGLVPDDGVVHHRERAVEVASSEGLVGGADGGEIFSVRGQGGRFYAVPAP